jgi:hypothetical protein
MWELLSGKVEREGLRHFTYITFRHTVLDCPICEWNWDTIQPRCPIQLKSLVTSYFGTGGHISHDDGRALTSCLAYDPSCFILSTFVGAATLSKIVAILGLDNRGDGSLVAAGGLSSSEYRL